MKKAELGFSYNILLYKQLSQHISQDKQQCIHTYKVLTTKYFVCSIV